MIFTALTLNSQVGGVVPRHATLPALFHTHTVQTKEETSHKGQHTVEVYDATFAPIVFYVSSAIAHHHRWVYIHVTYVPGLFPSIVSHQLSRKAFIYKIFSLNWNV